MVKREEIYFFQFGVIALPVSTFDFKCSLLGLFTVIFCVGVMRKYDVYMVEL